MNEKLSIAVFAALLGCASLQATEEILVASFRSNSLEQFTPSGTWVRTFASTGPYAPLALAQSPLTGEIFVTTIWASGEAIGQLTNIILRYHANGTFDANWDTFTASCSVTCPSPETRSLLFDESGNLWVADAYGEDFDQPIYVFEYLAADLTLPVPLPQPNPIVAKMYRANQMAFNAQKNLCIAGFIDEDVKCFDTFTGAQTADYYTEIHASPAADPEPGGLAFDSANRLYLSMIFTGQVIKETAPGGPMVVLATVTPTTSQLEGNLVLRAGYLYTTTYLYPPPEPPVFSTPDPVYKVSASSGALTNFIYETAPPELGNDHIWGGYWMIFYSTSF